MTTVYKLTDKDGRTRGETQWGEGVSYAVSGVGELYGPGWIHAYTHPLLAVLLNPIHGDFISPRLWEAEGVIGKTDHGLKVGCASLTTIKEIPLPEITTEQKAKFAILCALQVYPNRSFQNWAEDWLANKDRAEAAAWAAEGAARAAAWAARAAEGAARAAEGVAWAAEAATDLIAIAEEAIR